MILILVLLPVPPVLFLRLVPWSISVLFPCLVPQSIFILASFFPLLFLIFFLSQFYLKLPPVFFPFLLSLSICPSFSASRYLLSPSSLLQSASIRFSPHLLNLRQHPSTCTMRLRPYSIQSFLHLLACSSAPSDSAMWTLKLFIATKLIHTVGSSVRLFLPNISPSNTLMLITAGK